MKTNFSTKIPSFFVAKKGFLAICLMFTLIFSGAYLAQYFTWKVLQTVEPLTVDLTVPITTSGATYRSLKLMKSTFVHVVKSGTFTLTIDLTPAEKTALASVVNDLTVRVEIVGVSYHDFNIVKNGAVYSPLSTTFSLPSGDYTAKIYMKYWTEDVDAVKSASFNILVHMVESCG